MKRYKVILFDLDGTLTNSFEGIYRGMDYAYTRHGKSIAREDVHNYIGPPLIESFARDFSPTSKVEEVIATFREYYFTKGVYENEVYPGIEELLRRLHEDGFVIGTATSKQQPMAEEVMRYFGLDKYVDGIFAADEKLGRVDKCDIVKYAIEKLGANKADTVLVGDTNFDIEGADIVGIDNIIVAWGFGEEGIEHRTMKYVRDTHELYDYLTCK